MNRKEDELAELQKNLQTAQRECDDVQEELSEANTKLEETEKRANNVSFSSCYGPASTVLKNFNRIGL